MHEFDIPRSIAEEASGKCKKEGILAGELFLELGALSGYKSEPIEFFYEAIKKDYKELVESEIKIELKNGRAICNKCKKEFEIEDFWDIRCRECESRDFEVVGGEDVKLKRIKKWSKK